MRNVVFFRARNVLALQYDKYTHQPGMKQTQVSAFPILVGIEPHNSVQLELLLLHYANDVVCAASVENVYLRCMEKPDIMKVYG